MESDVPAILQLYSSLKFTPPPGQYTVAASFFLVSASAPRTTKIISLATGTKCLPTVRYPLKGEALHDSHAEILARRGAIYWFLTEIRRCQSSSADSGPYESPWIYRLPDGKYDLREDVQVNLYISTPPCGDASMRFLAAVQDPEMAALKDSTVYPTLDPARASRGRDNYVRLGVLRTKPGRADSPPTMCMSCSDKIASWSVLGFQGEVPIDMREVVREDCQRALGSRLGHVQDWHPGYTLHTSAIEFTSQPFIHSRTVTDSENRTTGNGSCNESLCWVADSKPYEVLINGMKRGVSPKHRFREKSRPKLSKISLLQLYSDMGTLFGFEMTTKTYRQAKDSILVYQAAKEKLMGVFGPFSGWVRSGAQWENFDLSHKTPEASTFQQSPLIHD